MKRCLRATARHAPRWSNNPRHFCNVGPSRDRFTVEQLRSRGSEADNVDLYGWVRSVRRQKKVAFVQIGDGTTIHHVQAIVKPEDAAALSTGAAVHLSGAWQASQGHKQSHELQTAQLRVLGMNDAEHSPLQPKYQTAEFLRTIPHLRPRVPFNALVLRLRSQVIAELTRFFSEEGFVQTHPPVITSSDCEGAGEVFTVASNATKDQAASSDVSSGHFFRTPKYLTVSAQLHLEALAQAVDKVWTLSPTFRAETSDTPRHLSEFYMLEAEVCFVEDLEHVMDVVERMLSSIAVGLSSSRIGTELLTETEQKYAQSPKTGEQVMPSSVLERRWKGLASRGWPRITYAQAIEILQKAASTGQATFEFKPDYDTGLQAEHERYIANTVGGSVSPVFVTDYPTAQKPFYMSPSLSTTNSKGREDTVACFDLLVPDLCELVGGSMREYRIAGLEQAMAIKGVAGNNLEWYQDLRKYGSVPHGGFGLGFDRLLCYLSGVGNLRDVVAFPRWHGRCEC